MLAVTVKQVLSSNRDCVKVENFGENFEWPKERNPGGPSLTNGFSLSISDANHLCHLGVYVLVIVLSFVLNYLEIIVHYRSLEEILFFSKNYYRKFIWSIVIRVMKIILLRVYH